MIQAPFEYEFVITVDMDVARLVISHPGDKQEAATPNSCHDN